MWAAMIAALGGWAAAATAEEVSAETGVRIELVTAEGPLFDDPRRRAAPVRSPEEVSAALETLRRELLRYPPAVRDRIGVVRLSGRITLDGRFAVGASNCAGARVAVGHGRPAPKSQELVSMALHHEIAHLTLCDRERREGWLALAPTSAPRGTARTMWPTDDPALLSLGFVTPYGATDPREDYAEYASTLLVHPVALAQREAAYPAVAKKAAYVREAYRALGVPLLPVVVDPPVPEAPAGDAPAGD